MKQLKIGENREMNASVASNRNKMLAQADIDRMILDFAIEGLLPYRFVSLPSFNRIIKAISPKFNVMSESTLKRRYADLATTITQNLKSIFGDLSFVATTTDGWSMRGRSFIGVTAHWIDPNTITRRWAALSCERLQGSHSYNVLAGAINSIHTKFGIAKKVVATTTDNASNFGKAFRMFGYVIEDLNHEEDGDAVDEDLIHPVSITEALIDQRRNVHQQLPPHQRCACHSLNLIATKDAENAESNSQFKKLYHSATAKAQAIWNKSSRSVQVAEAVLEMQTSPGKTKPDKVKFHGTWQFNV
jgi:hypothetical protein